MDKNTYTLGKKFECCGKRVVTDIMESRVFRLVTRGSDERSGLLVALLQLPHK